MVALGGHAWLLSGGMRGCSRGACVVARGTHLGNGLPSGINLSAAGNVRKIFSRALHNLLTSRSFMCCLMHKIYWQSLNIPFPATVNIS